MGILTDETIQNLAAVTKQAKINAGSNTDEQALQVAVLYPEWGNLAEGTTLTAGERVNYNGVLYKVLQTHQKQTSWVPDVSTSLFAPVLTSETGEILEWVQPDSTNGYMTGDRVNHVNKTWESLVDNNVWEPGTVGTEALWVEVTE